MTQSVQEQTQTPGSQTRATVGRSRRWRDQFLSLVVAAGCLLLGMALQRPMQQQRSAMVVENPHLMRQVSAEFPRLTLGGFRGVLVPMIWQQAEEDKNNRKWVELSTKYNLIAKLEPNFVTAYVFNSWNLGYNLSAQWHDVFRKYQWVLKGLDYLYEGEENNPGNPDVILEEAQLYFLKLGQSFERISYRKLWREHIAHQWQFQDQTLADKEAYDTHRQVLEYLRRPQFKATLIEDPNNPKKVGYGIRVHGYLDPKHPEKTIDFKYGVSPFYFAYVEYQRCIATGWPTTTSSHVVNAFPAMSLRMWCRDDLYYATGLIREMFAPRPTEKIADFDAKVFEIRDCFRNVQLNAPRAVELFDKHLLTFKNTETTHRKHIIETKYLKALGAAESETFEGLVQWYMAQQKPEAATEYMAEARRHWEAALLSYPQAIQGVDLFLTLLYPPQSDGRPNPERADGDRWIMAMEARRLGLQKLLNPAPNQPPDFSFLIPETVER